MPKVLVFFMLVWLGGFFAAGATAGAPLAVITGSVGMLCTLAVTAARISSPQSPAGRRGSG